MFWRIFVENRIIWKTVPLLSKSHESALRALGYSVLIFSIQKVILVKILGSLFSFT